MADYGFKTSDQNVLAPMSVFQMKFSSQYESFKVLLEKKIEVPSNSTLNVVHGLRYIPVFLLYAKSNLTANFKMLCTAARALTSLRSATTTYEVSVRDFVGTGARECFSNILEDPISLY